MPSNVKDLPMIDASDSVSLSKILTDHHETIEHYMLHQCRISTLPAFQIKAIHRGIFYDNSSMFVISKTGSGKSAISLTIASMQKGVSIIMVPLIGHGSDQVAKATFIEANAEAYHVDEHTYDDAKLLRWRLRGIPDIERDTVAALLYLSPRTLTE